MKNSSPLLIVAALFASVILMQHQPVSGNPSNIQKAELTQAAAHEGPGRYQLQAYGASSSGYYILDTHTGELWHGYQSRKPNRVAGPLNKE